MNNLAISELNIVLRSQSIVFRKLNFFDNLRSYSKPTDKKPDDESNKKKEKKPVYITLLGTDGKLTKSNLESAIKLSKRRNLKLIKVSDYDTIKQTPVYKLLTGVDVLKDDLISKKTKKQDTGLKNEKILTVSDNITSHDLNSKCNQLIKWIEKRHGVRVTITGSLSGNKVEVVYEEIEQKIKLLTRILQKRKTGNDIKFQVIPLKDSNQ